MPYVVPVLEERLSWSEAAGAVTGAAAGSGANTSSSGTNPNGGGKAASGGRCPREVSEEVRMQLAGQLLLLLRLAAKAAAAYAAEVVQVGRI